MTGPDLGIGRRTGLNEYRQTPTIGDNLRQTAPTKGEEMFVNKLAFAVAVIAASPAAADDAAMLDKARASLSTKLHDPETARYSDLRVVTAGDHQIVCGTVNAKNRMGGYDGAKPFLWDPRMSAGAIVYGGQAITDDPISNLAQVKGYRDSCGS